MQTDSDGRAAAARHRLMATLGGGFLVSGAIGALMGPMIVELEGRFAVRSGEAGIIFVALFGASAAGAVLSGYRLAQSPVIGYGAASLGLAWVALSGWPMIAVALLPVGFGIGLSVASTNLIVASLNPRSRGAALSKINLMWGLGAVGCPLLFAALRGRLPSIAAVWLLAVLAGAVWLALLRWLPRWDVPAASLPRAGEPRVRPAGLVRLAAILFLYVGIESAVGGWLVILSDQRGGGAATISLVIGSGFWAALLAGRALAPAILRRLSEPALYRVALSVSAVGMLALWLGDSRPSVAAGAILTGLGFAPLFPLTVSMLAAAVESTGPRRAGWVFAAGGLGGATVPWLTGRAAGPAGLVSTGFVVPIAGLALIAALALTRR